MSEETVYRITNAQTSFLTEQRSRARRYLFSMSLRTICFIAAIFAEGNLRIAFILGAIFLPYIAVVLANAGRERTFSPILSPRVNLNSNAKYLNKSDH